MSAPARYAEVQHSACMELARAHMGLVRHVAYHVVAKCPPTVDVHDLIQAGMVGLLEAAERYLPAQNTSFGAYAKARVLGAILDELRCGDWAPRAVRQKAREAAAALREVERTQCRPATAAEVAAKLGVSTQEYDRTLQDTLGVAILSLPEDADGEAETAAEDPGPDARLEVEHVHEALTGAVAALPDRERTVIALYYGEELNLKEIGVVLGVSESRVCQIHSQAVLRLRAHMQNWTPVAEGADA